MERRRITAVALLVVALTAPTAAQQPSLDGEWTLVSGTTDRTRDGTKGERPTKSHTTSGVAFNCGRACRIVHKGATLTIDQAQLDGVEESTSPAVTLQLEGRPETVGDSVNRGNKIDTVSRWDRGTLIITSRAFGASFTQTVSLEEGQLVVVTSSGGAGWKMTLRYAKK